MDITIIFIKDEMNTEAKKVEFVPLLDFEDDYEILNKEPFTIRRKSDHSEVKEYIRSDGYINVYLNEETKLKHRLIALQFIPNDDPEHKTEVDHWNHIRDDNHLENLHWVTPTENQRNKSSHMGIQYDFVDELSEDAIEVTDYGNHEFEDYYYDETVDNFYYFNGKQYKKLHDNRLNNGGTIYVNMIDIKNNKVKVCYNKFKRLYDLI